MRDDPGDQFSHNFSLIIISFDRDEDLPKRSRLDDVSHEVSRQRPTNCDQFKRHVGRFGESRNQTRHAQSIIQITKSCNECRVSFPHNVIQLVEWFVFSDVIKCVEISPSCRSCHPFHENLSKCWFVWNRTRNRTRHTLNSQNFHIIGSWDRNWMSLNK